MFYYINFHIDHCSIQFGLICAFGQCGTYNSHNHAIRETFSDIEQDDSNIFESLPTHSRARDRLLYGNGEKEPYLAVISGHSPLAENKKGGQNPPQADDNITKIKILILGIKAGGKFF